MKNFNSDTSHSQNYKNPYLLTMVDPLRMKNSEEINYSLSVKHGIPNF